MPIPDCLSANKGENRCPTQFCCDGKLEVLCGIPDIYLQNMLLTISNGTLSIRLGFTNNMLVLVEWCYQRF